MMRGKYNDAWEEFPIEKGEVWIAYNETQAHKFLCADLVDVILDENLLWQLTGGIKMDIIYTDPPWNPRIFSQFYNQAEEEPVVEFKEFLIFFLKLLKLNSAENAKIFIEMGLDYHTLLLGILKKLKAETCLKMINRYDRNTKSNFLWAGNFSEGFDIETPEIMQGKEAIYFVNEFIEDGDNFFDPCIGEGMFFRPAIRAGKKFNIFGIELQKRKLANALRFLRNKKYSITKLGGI